MAVITPLAILLVAIFARGFRLDLQRRLLGTAIAMFLSVTILSGCGGNSSGDSTSFSASPANNGTPGSTSGSASGGTSSGASGSSTGGGSSSTPPSNTATSVKVVTVSSASIAAGATSSASVTLNAAAPAGGANVALTSSKPSAASVPASIIVAEGQTSINFTVTTGSVTSDTSVTITAAYNNTLAGIKVFVTAPISPPPPSMPVSISLSPSSVSIAAQANLQFTATVTGTTNTSVSWTATSGNITSAGLFTAPNVSVSTAVTVSATSQANPTVVQRAQVTVTPPPPPSGGGTPYSGSGPVASWKAFQYLDSDGIYHQAIEIYNAQAPYPVIGYAYSNASCTSLGDTFNDFWQPIGNGIWWFIHDPELVHVKWVWYSGTTNPQILQQTPCIDYSAAPKYN